MIEPRAVRALDALARMIEQGVKFSVYQDHNGEVVLSYAGKDVQLKRMSDQSSYRMFRGPKWTLIADALVDARDSFLSFEEKMLEERS